MKTYNKRIAFLMSSEYLKPAGGVGQFAKAIADLMNTHGIKVDIITDKKPHDKDFAYNVSAKVYYPSNNLGGYPTHSIMFSHGDSYNYERMSNYRTAIMMAFSENMYDAFVCNTYETVRVAIDLGMSEFIQMIGYTHLESQIFNLTSNPFLNDVNISMRSEITHPSITVGTQSKFNQLQFENAHDLPIPMPEKGLLEEYHKPREGVLFIGRHEPGKKPDLFVELIKQTGLPARVITSDNGYEAFEKAFEKAGITDYKILSEVVGTEKVDFITGCRVAFNPSVVESYGIAFLEQTTQMPTVAFENMRWTNNFNSKYFYTCNKKNMVDVVTELYNKFETASSWYDTGALKHTIEMENSIFHKWRNCLNSHVTPTTNVNTAGILKHTTIKYKDYIDGLNRKGKLSLADDLKSIYNNKNKFRIIYTETDTWLTKDPLFEPNEDDLNGLGLFEGL